MFGLHEAVRISVFQDYGLGEVTKRFSETEQCFNYVGSRWYAVGGKDAYRREYPHMRSDNVSMVALGILKRSDPLDLWNIYAVEAFIPHPEYHPPSKYNDIALIRTQTRIIFGGAVLPACLPHNNIKQEWKEENEECAFATGWGNLGHRSDLADMLQKVQLKRFEQSECSKQYPVHRHLKRGFDHATQMCYGDKEQVRDTCEGDSGGPLHWKMICPSVVFGVTSAGHPCGFTGEAGLYTRVQAYVPWIESIVWP